MVKHATCFKSYIGVDYSGGGHPEKTNAGIQVYRAEAQSVDGPEKVTFPGNSRRKHWSRPDLAEWLLQEVSKDEPILVGLDHGFSFPEPYFEEKGLETWDELLNHLEEWDTRVQWVKVALDSIGAPSQSHEQLRLTEEWTSSAKSVFQYEGVGAVGKATLAGIPWLQHIREEAEGVHFWPFDGFEIPEASTVIAEVYPSIFKNRYPQENRDTHEQDAYATARWMKERDSLGFLEDYFEPRLTTDERERAKLEGWILGIS